MEDDNKNGRQPQINRWKMTSKNRKTTSKKIKWKTTSKKMEDNLNKNKMDDDLKKIWKRTSKNEKMEDDHKYDSKNQP